MSGAGKELGVALHFCSEAGFLLRGGSVWTDASLVATVRILPGSGLTRWMGGNCDKCF